MSWSEHGIAFGQGPKGIMRVSPNGGKPEVLASVDGTQSAHGPQILPDGQAVLFTVSNDSGATWDTAQIVVQALSSGERKILIEGGADGRYLPTGHIVYAHSGSLFAVSFDLRRRQVTSVPVPVVEGVRRAGATGTAQFDFSETGSMVYIPGPLSTGLNLMVPVGLGGGSQP